MNDSSVTSDWCRYVLITNFNSILQIQIRFTIVVEALCSCLNHSTINRVESRSGTRGNLTSVVGVEEVQVLLEVCLRSILDNTVRRLCQRSIGKVVESAETVGRNHRVARAQVKGRRLSGFRASSIAWCSNNLALLWKKSAAGVSRVEATLHFVAVFWRSDFDIKVHRWHDHVNMLGELFGDAVFITGNVALAKLVFVVLVLCV